MIFVEAEMTIERADDVAQKRRKPGDSRRRGSTLHRVNRICIAVASAMALSASLGCYKTVDIPPSELATLRFTAPDSTSLRTESGDAVKLTSGSTLVLSTCRQHPDHTYSDEYTQIRVSGGTFEGTTTDGRTLRVELATICQVKVSSFSFGRTVAIPSAILIAVGAFWTIYYLPAFCAAPDTPIATPTGDRPIASLRKGDLVWSVDRGRIVAVPIASIVQTPVEPEHMMVRVKFANGTVLRISPGHPTADGRTFGDLRKGDRLDHQELAEVSRVTYGEPFTYDILPASDTGAYFAGGALIGSTLWRGDGSVAATAPP
jgi:hypothetical protein